MRTTRPHSVRVLHAAIALALSQGAFAQSAPTTAPEAENPKLAQATDAGYMAGIPLAPWYPHLDDCFLVCVTEKRTKSEIDGLAEVLSARRESTASRPHSRLASMLV